MSRSTRGAAALIVVALGLAAVFAGCEFSASHGGISKRMTNRFAERDGLEEHAFAVNKTVTADVSISARMDAGKVTVSLIDPTGETIEEWSGARIEKNRRIHLEPGDWTIRIRYEKARDGELIVSVTS